MPKVGDKEFPYTEKGERQAQIYARQTGRQVEYDTNTYGHGSYQEGGEVGDEGGELSILDRLKRFSHGYYNVTPPKTWSGERKPHWSDDYEKKDPLYYNSPKLWYPEGKEPKSGERYWNDPDNPSLWKRIKDKFGFGSYQEGGEVSQALKKDKAFDTSLQSEFAAAIQRELNPPKDQGRDRHLDNLKVILEYSRKYPEHFAQVMNMKDNKGDIARLKDRLTRSFAKYGEDEINSLMWGNDEWKLMQQGGPVKRRGYGY